MRQRLNAQPKTLVQKSKKRQLECNKRSILKLSKNIKFQKRKKKIHYKISTNFRANQKPECTKQELQRRRSDPSIDTTLDSFGANKKLFLNSSLLLPLKSQNNVKSKPELASEAKIPQNFKRSQSLRFHEYQENAEYEDVADTTTNVKNLIDLWNSKTKHK